MTLLQLKYVLAIAETGTVTAAAEKMFIAQPSLSKSIRLLEEELGFTIFIRNRNGATLSREGVEFVEYARRVVEESDLLEERYGKSRKRKKKIVISAQHGRSAYEAFASILKEFGGDEYAFTLRHVSAMKAIQDVISGQSELGVIILRKEYEKTVQRLIRENDLEFTPVYQVKAVAWMSGEHPLAAGDTVYISQLPAWPIVKYDGADDYFSDDILSGREFPKSIAVSGESDIPGILRSVNAIFVGGENCLSKKEGIVSRQLNKTEVLHVGVIRKRNTYLSSIGSLFIEELEMAGTGRKSNVQAGDAYIRDAVMEDLPYLMEIYAFAKRFMNETGNPDQWSEDYPGSEDIVADILKGSCHVCVEKGKIQAVFSVSTEKTKGYDELLEGEWLRDGDDYVTVHRLASLGKHRGMADLCLDWCEQRYTDLRADTHEKNRIIQHILEDRGYVKIGKVRIFNGQIQLAYQKLLPQ